MTAARNIKKCEKGFFENIPKFKTLWETYENDPFKKVKKKKKKKKWLYFLVCLYNYLLLYIN